MNENIDILNYIYFSLTNKKELIKNFIFHKKNEISKIENYYNNFLKTFKILYNIEVNFANLQKKDTKEVENLLEDENENIRLFNFIRGKTDNFFYFMENIFSSYEYGINFLYLFNLEHKIFSYENITLLAAGINNAISGEYLLKNFEFQNYYYSICMEKVGLYRFEILSNSGDLNNKIIKISIKQPKGKIDIIEEKCNVITDKYTLYYKGSITNETEIIPNIYAAEDIKE